MNSGSSASITSGSHSSDWRATVSCHQTSRPSFIVTSPPVCWWTSTNSTQSTPLASSWSMAASTLALSGTVRPPRLPSSWVITALQSESSTRSAIADAEKPPKITE